MITTSKDRHEKKLRAFYKELNEVRSNGVLGARMLDLLKKKYGLNVRDYHRAVKLIMSIANKDQYADGIGYKKCKLNAREKSFVKLETAMARDN